MKKQTFAEALATTNSTSNYGTEKQTILHKFVHWIADLLDRAE